MSVIRFTLLSMLLSFSLLFTRCSLSPIAGGVETGNPATTCAVAVFDALDSNNAWLPSSYLIDGIGQLNPSTIYDDPSNHLAKVRAVAGTYDSVGFIAPDTIIVRVYVVKIDTLIKVDSTFIRDTIERQSVVVDTIDTLESFVLVNKNQVDSIFIADTIIRFDTTFSTHTDTTYAKRYVAPGTVSVTPLVMDTVRTKSQYSYLPSNEIKLGLSTNDSLTLNLDLIDNSAMSVRSTSTVAWVSSQTDRNGLAVFKQYTDLDGDGKLYMASVISPGSHLYASYTGNRSTTYLNVNFDAGLDKRFDLTDDNNIFSLKREMKENSLISESVLYGREYIACPVDSPVLSRLRYFYNDSSKSLIVRYISSTIDTTDYHKNALCKMEIAQTFRSGKIKSIVSEVSFVNPLLIDHQPSNATIQATMTYFDGHIALLDGLIDFENSVLDGEIDENGSVSIIRYDNLTKKFTRDSLR